MRVLEDRSFCCIVTTTLYFLILSLTLSLKKNFIIIYMIFLLLVHMLLGWDRPVYGRVASLQLLNMIEVLDKSLSSIGTIIPSKQPTTVTLSLSESVLTPLSVSLTAAYHEIIPKVFSALAGALQRETPREGGKDYCSLNRNLDI